MGGHLGDLQVLSHKGSLARHRGLFVGHSSTGSLVVFWLKPFLPWMRLVGSTTMRDSRTFGISPGNGSSKPLVLAGLSGCSQGVTPTQLRELMPFQLPRQARMSVWILALGAALGWFPEYRSNAYLEQVAHEQRMETAGKKLVEFVRREIKNPPSGRVCQGVSSRHWKHWETCFPKPN